MTDVGRPKRERVPKLFAGAALAAIFLVYAAPARAQLFGARMDFATAGGANAMAVGDFDEDGGPDLAVTNGDIPTTPRHTPGPGTPELFIAP